VCVGRRLGERMVTVKLGSGWYTAIERGEDSERKIGSCLHIEVSLSFAGRPRNRYRRGQEKRAVGRERNRMHAPDGTSYW